MSGAGAVGNQGEWNLEGHTVFALCPATSDSPSGNISELSGVLIRNCRVSSAGNSEWADLRVGSRVWEVGGSTLERQ